MFAARRGARHLVIVGTLLVAPVGVGAAAAAPAPTAGPVVPGAGVAATSSQVTLGAGTVSAEASAGSEFGAVLRVTDGLVQDGPDVAGSVSLNENGYAVNIDVSHDVTTRTHGFAVDSVTSFGGAIPTDDPGAFAEARVSIEIPFTVHTSARFDLRAGFTGCGGVTLRDAVRGIDIAKVESPVGVCEEGLGNVLRTGVLRSSGYVLLVGAIDGETGAGFSLDDQLLLELDVAGTPCTVLGTEGNDALAGTAGADVICGMGGNDTLDGKGGNDVLLGGNGADLLVGGTGADLLVGCAGGDVLDGGDGADQVRGGYPLAGGVSEGCTSRPTNDGRDRIVGGAGDDTIDSGTEGDLVIGGAGADVIRPGAGADIVNAGPGHDLVIDGAGLDRLAGCDGDDTLRGGADRDLLAAGRPLPGFFPSSGTVVRGVDARTCAQDATTARNTLVGGTGDDELVGDRGIDTLLGEAGVDALNGRAGNDVLRGGAQNDTLRLGPGRDTAEGGDGSDSFFAVDKTRDTVKGGAGFDTARLDGVDARSSIERRL